jgi:hypothetical protein
MLITATTTSAKLQDLISEADFTLIKNRCGSCAPDGRYLVFLQVSGSNDVYIDLYKASTTTDGAKITNSTGEFSLSISDLQDINLIASGGDSAIKIIITK